MEGRAWAQAWDEGCTQDAVRNDLLLPHLRGVLDKYRPINAADLGCGTAFIARKLASSGAGQKAHWYLLDKRQAALEFAERLWPASVPASFRLADLEFSDLDLEEIDLALLAFTLMEIPLTDALAANLLRTLRKAGKMVVVMPDTMQDILEADAALARRILNSMESGYFSASKTDKFTGEKYPFLFQRNETVIATLLRAGAMLCDATRLCLPSGKATYVFIFEKV